MRFDGPPKLNLATDPNHLHATVKPASALIPYRSIAAISSSSSKPASAVTAHNPSGNPSLSVTGKPRREVPLPSQEEKKGAMQYALYVLFALPGSSKWLIFVSERLWTK